MKNIFDKEVTQELIERINTLNPDSQSLWGTMNVSQMLAHCNVTYALIYDGNYKKLAGVKKLLIRAFVKPLVVSEKPFKKNSPPLNCIPRRVRTEVPLYLPVQRSLNRHCKLNQESEMSDLLQ